MFSSIFCCGGIVGILVHGRSTSAFRIRRLHGGSDHLAQGGALAAFPLDGVHGTAAESRPSKCLASGRGGPAPFRTMDAGGFDSDGGADPPFTPRCWLERILL